MTTFIDFLGGFLALGIPVAFVTIICKLVNAMTRVDDNIGGKDNV